MFCQDTDEFKNVDLDFKFCSLGCSDPVAENYNAVVSSDDGSCTYSCTTLTVTGSCSHGAINGAPQRQSEGSCRADAYSITLAWWHIDPNLALGVYTIAGTLMNSKPQYTKAGFPVRRLYWSGDRWVLDDDLETSSYFAAIHQV